MDPEIFDVDAPMYEADAEQTPTETPAAPTPTPPASTARGDGEAAPAKAEASVPPPENEDSEKSKPVKAEGDDLAKLKNDLALAKKDQAAAARKLAEIDRREKAAAQARIEEYRYSQQLIAQGKLTQEEVLAAPQRQADYIAFVEAEAAKADAQAEAVRLAAETDAARDAREAAIYLKEQAQPLHKERIALGLPDDIDPEAILAKHLETPDRLADTALTWQQDGQGRYVIGPEEQARIAQRVMDGAMADAKAEMLALAEAKGTTETQKADRTRFDRTTATGPATGGRDILPTFVSAEDDIRAAYAS